MIFISRPEEQRPKGWLTADMQGQARVGQYVDTMLLRLKVKLFYRRWRRVKRRFLDGWMSRG